MVHRENERNTNTTAKTGQKSYAHVIMKVFIALALWLLRCFQYKLYRATTNAISVAGTRIKLKSKSMSYLILYSYFIDRLSIQPRTLLVGFQHYPLASCVSYLLLFRKQFLLTRNVTTITFCQYVFTHCFHSRTCNNLCDQWQPESPHQTFDAESSLSSFQPVQYHDDAHHDGDKS